MPSYDSYSHIQYLELQPHFLQTQGQMRGQACSKELRKGTGSITMYSTLGCTMSKRAISKGPMQCQWAFGDGRGSTFNSMAMGGGGGREEPRNSLGSVDAILSVCSHAGVCDIFKWRPSNSTPQRGEVFYGGDARWGLRKEEGVTPTPPHPTLACAGKALGGCKFHGLRLDVSEAWKARLSFRLRRGILSLQAASGF